MFIYQICYRSSILSNEEPIYRTEASIYASPPDKPKTPNDVFTTKVIIGVGQYLIICLVILIVFITQWIFLGNTIWFLMIALFFPIMPYLIINSITREHKSYRRKYPYFYALWEDEYNSWSDCYECQKCEKRFAIQTNKQPEENLTSRKNLTLTSVILHIFRE